jgi:hypothetical protein
MNVWRCERDGCAAIAKGEGGATGLLAIGWYFRKLDEPGGGMFCPAHHPKGFELAEAQAFMIQGKIKELQLFHNENI